MERKTRVLVVDDEPGILRFIRIKLALSGYEVITTTSGEEALRLVESEKPDIMLLDLLMVPMSGFDVLQRLRPTSPLPVILVTARSFTADEALKLGANDFVGKPFKPDELVKKIEAILDSHSVGA